MSNLKISDASITRLSSLPVDGFIPFARTNVTTAYVLRPEATNVGSPVADVFWTPGTEPSWLAADAADVSGFGDTGDIANLDYATLISYWEALRAAYPDYVTRSSLGTSEDGGYTIWEYRLCPAAPTRKMLWVTGEHGGETTAMATTYRIAYHLCANWTTYGALGFVRNQIDLRIIPSLNPWGLDNSSTPNSNGVNITYNVACSNWGDTSDDAGTPGRLTPGAQYWGASAASEAETVIFQNWIASHSDATTLISAHALGSDPGDANVYYTMREDAYDDLPVREVVQWLDENDTTTNNVVNWVLPTKYASETIGCHALLIEFPDGHFSTAHDATEMTRALKWYGNVLCRYARLSAKPAVTSAQYPRGYGGFFSQGAAEIQVANGAYGEIPGLNLIIDCPGTGILIAWVNFTALNYAAQTNLFFRTYIEQIGTQFVNPNAAYHEQAQTLPLGTLSPVAPTYTSCAQTAIAKVLQTNDSGNDPPQVRVRIGAYAGHSLVRLWRVRVHALWIPQTDAANALSLYDASAHIADGDGAMTTGKFFPS